MSRLVRKFPVTPNTQEPFVISDAQAREIAEQSLPPFFAADRYSAALARQNVIEYIVRSITGLEIAPEAVPILQRHILEGHERALLAGGSPVGVWAGIALSAHIHQLYLSAIHIVGQGKSSGLNLLKDILAVKPVRQKELSILRYRRKPDGTRPTLRDVLASRSRLVSLSILDLLVRDTQPEYRLAEEDGTLYPWQIVYRALHGTPQSTYYLRLRLDHVKMITYGVQMSRVPEYFAREEDSPVWVEYCPHVITDSRLGAGIVNIYPRRDEVTEVVQKLLRKGSKQYRKADAALEELGAVHEQMFLEKHVVPEMRKVRLQGVKGLTNLVPVFDPVWCMVEQERQVDDQLLQLTNLGLPPELQEELQRGHQTGAYWALYLSQRAQRLTGLEVEDFYALLRLLLIRPVYLYSGRHVGGVGTRPPWFVVIVQLPETAAQPPGTYPKPGVYLQRLLEEEYETSQEQDQKAEQQFAVAYQAWQNTVAASSPGEPAPVRPPRATLPLREASEVAFAELDGCNLFDLLAMEDLLDAKRTTCNNYHQIYEALGIEACRQALLRDLAEVLALSGNTSPKHSQTFVDMMTARGIPLGAQFKGMVAAGSGWFSVSSFQRSGSAMARAVELGGTEKVTSNSAAIAVGGKITVGTGRVQVIGPTTVAQVREQVAQIPAAEETWAVAPEEAAAQPRSYLPRRKVLPNIVGFGTQVPLELQRPALRYRELPNRSVPRISGVVPTDQGATLEAELPILSSGGPVVVGNNLISAVQDAARVISLAPLVPDVPTRSADATLPPLSSTPPAQLPRDNPPVPINPPLPGKIVELFVYLEWQPADGLGQIIVLIQSMMG